MDTEAFIRWALHDDRTIEERYTVELLVEGAVIAWHHKHQTGVIVRWEEKGERDRQRRLNPAYEPSYSELWLRRAAEILAERTKLELNPHSYSSRVVRDLSVLRLLPHLEEVSVSGAIADCSVFADLPRLRSLGFTSTQGEDYRPIGRCAGLRSLSLHLASHWPEVAGLEQLQGLEFLALTGNLLVMPPGTTYPRVRRAQLSCTPLYAKNVRALPQLPACQVLTLAGVERLDGIEAMPGLRDLVLNSSVRSFEPLTALRELTGITHVGDAPQDVEPLARLPRLHCLSLTTGNVIGAPTAPLRDLSPLLGAPALRELHQRGCAPLELEVAAINAALPPCDDLFLTPEPRPLRPAPRFIIAPSRRHPRPNSEEEAAEIVGPVDLMLRRCEVRWVGGYLDRQIAGRIGHEDWGTVSTHDTYRSITVAVECFEVLERFPEIVAATCEALNRLRAPYRCILHISLRVPPPPMSPAQAELERQFRDARDEADFARRREEEREALERQYLLQLKQQQGEPIDPEEFAAPPSTPLPVPDEEDEADEEEDDDGEGGIAEKEKPMVHLNLWDDEHPLADQYRLWMQVSPDELWVDPRQRDIAVYLLRREPDEVIPEEKQS